MSTTEIGRKTDEQALVDTLVKLVAAGEDGIVTRRFDGATPTGNVIVIRSESDDLLVGKVEFACLERLESRGLATRAVSTFVGVGGRSQEERFIRTEQALVALYHGDAHTVAEVSV
jgi:hypothetical protein